MTESQEEDKADSQYDADGSLDPLRMRISKRIEFSKSQERCHENHEGENSGWAQGDEKDEGRDNQNTHPCFLLPDVCRLHDSISLDALTGV